MASFKEDENRNVVPNWREYNKTARLGEFGSVAAISKPFEFFPIDEYIYSWQNNKTIPYAGDLISAAILNGQESNINAIEAAHFIIFHKDEATEILVCTAKEIISTPANNTVSTQLTVSQRIEKIINQEKTYRQNIKLLKQSRNYCCFNSIAYCELARCYVTLGQFEKAKEAIEIAIHLAPNHRYVCRSAARFFLHYGDQERARYVVAHNPALLNDPWLLASEIAINTLMNRTSRNIKKASELITSNNYSSFCLSELSSAIGSIEMINSNMKKCRSYFKVALRNPNDNSLAQAQFLLSKDPNLSFDFDDNILLPNSFEADALSAYIKEDYSKSLVAAVDWIEDMPFTRRPVQFAANIAYSFLKDYDTAIDILNLGLKSNPNSPMLLNNKAYACALNGKIDVAEEIINDAKRLQMPTDAKVCLTATEGLCEYRKGNIEEGRRLYQQAILLAKDSLSNPRLVNTAILNYTREEIKANANFDKSLFDVLDKIPDDCKETIQLKKDIKSESICR